MASAARFKHKAVSLVCSGLALVIVTHVANSRRTVGTSALVQAPRNGEHLYDGLYTITDSPIPRKARKQPYVPALVPSLPSPVKVSKRQASREKLSPQQRAAAEVDNALESVRHTSQIKVSGLGALDRFPSSRGSTMGALGGPAGADKENTLGALFSLSHRLQRKQEELERTSISSSSAPKLSSAESKNALGREGHHRAEASFHPRRPPQRALQPSPSVDDLEEHRLEQAQAEIARMQRELDAERRQGGGGRGREEAARLRTGSLSLRHILKGFPGLQGAFTTMYDKCGFGPCTLHT